MTALEISVLGTAAVVTAATIGYVMFLVRTSGVDLEVDEERLAETIRTAPYDRLDNIYPKR